jgi:hypothetical protein
MPEVLLDDFERLTGWTRFTSGLAKLNLSLDHGTKRKAMRLDFDFCGGGGSVVARKAFPIEIPEDYSFGFHIRGVALPTLLSSKILFPKPSWS